MTPRALTCMLKDVPLGKLPLRPEGIKMFYLPAVVVGWWVVGVSDWRVALNPGLVTEMSEVKVTSMTLPVVRTAVGIEDPLCSSNLVDKEDDPSYTYTKKIEFSSTDVLQDWTPLTQNLSFLMIN